VTKLSMGTAAAVSCDPLCVHFGRIGDQDSLHLLRLEFCQAAGVGAPFRNAYGYRKQVSKAVE